MKLISINEKTRKYRLQISVVVVAIALWLFFYSANPRLFLTSYTYSALMSVIPITIILALSSTFVISCALIDLSFPSIMSFSSLVFVRIWVTTGNGILALLGCLLSGALLGIFNGFLVVKVRIPALLATLGSLFFLRGVVMVITQAWPTSLTAIKGEIVHTLLVGRLPFLIKEGVPAQMIWAIILAVICWFLLNRHVYGVHVCVTGDNMEAARLMGVNVDKIKFLVYMQMGLFASFAGIISSLENLTYWPTMGEVYLLLAIAATVVGGTSIAGGSGTVFGSFIGACILGTIETGLMGAGLTGFWTNLVFGLIILFSLASQVQLRK